MKQIKYIFIFVFAFFTVGCFNDLDTVPTDPDLVTSEVFYTQEGAYKQVLAKIYAGLATTGQQGPDGKGDLGGINEGFSNYLRQLWYQQELTTDEAVIGWNDETIHDFHALGWSAGDVFINGFYNRIFYQIGVCNEFLRQSSDEALDRRETSDALRAEVQEYRIEARFMRALSYWHALDAFRNVPFVTEEDAVGSFFPEQIKAPELFNYIESELLEIEGQMKDPRTNEYARADKAAAWMLLAKLYMNAEVYIGTDRYNDALTYCRNVIDAGYVLDSEFTHLFLADNHLSQEIIFPVAFDGVNTRTWGGTTFIINASTGGGIPSAVVGTNEGWGGTRTTKQIVNLFDAGGNSGVITDFNPGNTGLKVLYVAQEIAGEVVTDASVSISTLSDNDAYEGYKYFEAGVKIQFRNNPGNFSIKYGDNDGDGTLETNGDFIAIPAEGFYKITVDLNSNSYSIEEASFVAQGSGIQGGSAELTYNSESGFLEAKTDFHAGDFIIIDQLNSSNALGDNDGNGLLTYGGNPITTFATPGELKVDLKSQDYTYQLSSTSFDRRAIFGGEEYGQLLEIESIPVFSNGYAVLKFKNFNRDGSQGSNGTHPDTDFPLFRLADAYLMASECILRGASGSQAEADDFFNRVRARAYQSTLANITNVTLDDILDERARELMWEAHRRTDLIRFNKFVTDEYLWAWKGAPTSGANPGPAEGQAVSDFRRIFPIPSSDLNNNPNLEQNPGY